MMNRVAILAVMLSFPMSAGCTAVVVPTPDVGEADFQPSGAIVVTGSVKEGGESGQGEPLVVAPPSRSPYRLSLGIR